MLRVLSSRYPVNGWVQNTVPVPYHKSTRGKESRGEVAKETTALGPVAGSIHVGYREGVTLNGDLSDQDALV